jgi:protein-tyrosine phosphatase
MKNIKRKQRLPMFSIFKRKKPAVLDLSPLKTDMHSHILPGIDDGSPDLETSLYLVNGLIETGYSNFIATPHILWDMYKNDEHTIGNAKAVLQQGFNEQKFSSKLNAAAEYYMDEHFDELVRDNIPLLTIKENWVLVEWSFISPPMDLKEKLFELQIKGYQPILAHPERYTYFANNKKAYDELFATGAFFQVNLLSLTGYYGKVVQELAQHLVKKNYIRLIGTDMHHERHLDVMRSSSGLNDAVKELLDTGLILNGEL